MRIKLTFMAVAGAFLLGACGGGGAAAPSAAPASSPATAKPATSAGESAAAKPATSAGESAAATPAASANAASSAKPAASGSAAAAGETKLNVSYSAIVPMTLPVWMANDEGLFKQNGLNVDLTYIESSKGIPAVISGEIQIANLGGPESLSAVAGGADLVSVACESPSWPFVMQAVSGINNMQELKGKKVGVSNFGSASDIATRIALQHENIDPNKDVAIIAVGSATNRIAALKSGAIQGGMSFPPDSYVMEAQGFKTIFDMGPLHIPGSVATDTMQRAWMNANKATVQKYVDSIVQALARIRADKATAAKVLGKYTKQDDQQALSKTVDYFVANVYPTLPDAKVEQYKDAQAILGASNATVKGYDVSKMLDDSFVQNAGSRGVDKK